MEYFFKLALKYSSIQKPLCFSNLSNEQFISNSFGRINNRAYKYTMRLIIKFKNLNLRYKQIITI